MSRSILCAMLLAILASAFVSAAQPDEGDSAAREKAFIEALQRENPASAARFIALRDAQQKALAELQSTEGRANAAPPALRPSFLPQLKQARKKYVDSQLKILDFLDERDRGIVARLQEEIGRFNRELEGRQKSRDELKKLLPE
jgi:hypothetical protein